VGGLLAEGASLLGRAEERRDEHLSLVGFDGDQGRLAPFVAYEVEGEGDLLRLLGGPEHDVARVEKPGSFARDHEYVIFPRRCEDLHGAPIF
jgi:hypothetical protein